MKGFQYEGIEFAKGARPSFADFKVMCENTEAFKKVPRGKKEAQMNKVHSDLLKHSDRYFPVAKEETPKEETPKEETPKEETPKEETPKKAAKKKTTKKN